MTDPLDELVALLELEQLEPALFRGNSMDIGTSRIFGGQVLGQALKAMQATVDNGKSIHSMHAYFMREGDHQIPITYEVSISRDGKSFSTRLVTALQYDKPVFIATASFQLEENGFEFQQPMPSVPGPEACKELPNPDPAYFEKLTGDIHSLPKLSAPFVVRPVSNQNLSEEPFQQTWIKTGHSLPDDRILHRAILAYLSDYGLITTILLPHGLNLLSPQLQLASIDHAIWFHRDFRTDQWLLYECEPLITTGARGLARGRLYREDGVLIATVLQEGLIRQKKGQ